MRIFSSTTAKFTARLPSCKYCRISFLYRPQEKSKAKVRPGSIDSLESSTNVGYAASNEGTVGTAVVPPSVRPPGAPASPSSTRSNSSDGKNSAERLARLRRGPFMDYIVPEWNPLAALGPSSASTGYAASSEDVVGGALSADNRSRSSGASQPNSDGAPSAGVTLKACGVIPDTTTHWSGDRLAACVDLASSSSESPSWKPPWLEAPSSVRNRCRSGGGSSVNGVVYPLEPTSPAAPSTYLRCSGVSCRPRLTRTSASDENGPAFTVTRLPLASLAVSTESSKRPLAASDGLASAESGLLLRPSSSPSSSSNPLTWDPGNHFSLEPKKGEQSVDPTISVTPLPRSREGSMSLVGWRTPRCLQLDRATVGQASPIYESGSSGRRHSLLLASLATSPASPQVPFRGEGREFPAKNSSTADETSLHERPPFSGSSIAGSSLDSGRLEQVRCSLPLPETASWLVAGDVDSGRASFQSKPPRLTSFTLSVLGDSTNRLLPAGEDSTGSPDSLDAERFSEALLSSTSSTFSRYARRGSGQSLSSSGSLSTCGGCCPLHSTSRRASFTLSVSATPWRSLVEHGESPSSAGSSSPIGCRIVYASPGQTMDKPSSLVKEMLLPDDGPTASTIGPARSTTGDEEDTPPCPDAVRSPVLEQGVTDTVSASWTDFPSPANADDGPATSTIGSDEGKSPSPDAVRSPVVEQGITDMVLTLQEDLSSPATTDDVLARSTIGNDEGKGPCPAAVRSPVLKQGITDTVSTSGKESRSVLAERKAETVSTRREYLSSPAAEHSLVKRDGSNAELVAPFPTLELQVTDYSALTSRSDEPPPEDPLVDDCSGVATAASTNCGIEIASVPSLPSVATAEATNIVVSLSPWSHSRADGGRGLRFGDSPSVSQRGSSDSSWSLTKHVAPRRADASHDGSDSSWSLTKAIASGDVDVSTGKTRNPGSPISELSFRMTLEHGPQPSTKGSVGPSLGSDTSSAPTPAAHNADSATEGKNNRIILTSPVSSDLNSGPSEGRGSTHGQDADQSRRAGRVVETSPMFGSTMSEPTREIVHFTTGTNPSISRKTTSCARLYTGYPSSVSERRTSSHRARSSSVRRLPVQSACSDVSARQRSNPSSSTRRTPSSSSEVDGCGSTQSTNNLPSTVVPRQKMTTGVSRAPRGRIEHESSGYLRSSSTPSTRTSARDTRSKRGKQRGGVPPAVPSSDLERPSSTTRSNVRIISKSSSILKNGAPVLAPVTVQSSQLHAYSNTSSSTASDRLRVSEQRGGESTKSTPNVRASPAKLDVISSSHRSSQQSDRISAVNGTTPRRSGSRRSPAASRSTSFSAPMGEPRRGEIMKSTSIPRRSSIEVKTTKTSRFRSLAIQSRLNTAITPPVPPTRSRVRSNRSSCPSPSFCAAKKVSEGKNRPRTSTGQNRIEKPQRGPNDTSRTPVFLSSACASTAGSVDVVSKEAKRTSISGCSGGVNGGSREEEDNPFHCSALDGSTTVSENRGVCGAGIIYNLSLIHI